MTMYQPGDHVKVEFLDEKTGESEWMWVRVESVDDERKMVFGLLDNEPVVHAKLKLGGQLAVSYGQIRDHRRF